jgi:hypothetical protein
LIVNGSHSHETHLKAPSKIELGDNWMQAGCVAACLEKFSLPSFALKIQILPADLREALSSLPAEKFATATSIAIRT